MDRRVYESSRLKYIRQEKIHLLSDRFTHPGIMGTLTPLGRNSSAVMEERVSESPLIGSRWCRQSLLSTPGVCSLPYTEQTIFPFPFKLNRIWSWWPFSFQLWTKWNSIQFKIKKKTVSTITCLLIWKTL